MPSTLFLTLLMVLIRNSLEHYFISKLIVRESIHVFEIKNYFKWRLQVTTKWRIRWGCLPWAYSCNKDPCIHMTCDMHFNCFVASSTPKQAAFFSSYKPTQWVGVRTFPEVFFFFKLICLILDVLLSHPSRRVTTRIDGNWYWSYIRHSTI